MNGQWDTSCDVTLIVFLIVSALYVIIAIGIRIAFFYYCFFCLFCEKMGIIAIKITNQQ